MRPRPLVTTGVTSMFAGELFFIHQNIESHAYNWVVALIVWTVFGIAAGFAGDRVYNDWQMNTTSSFVRFVKLWTVIAVIFLVAYLLSRLAFWLA